MRRIAFAGLLLSLAAFGSNPAPAAVILEAPQPEVDVTLNGSLSQFLFSFGDDGKTVAGRGEAANGDYSFTFLGNSDPLINWGFTATVPGLYHVTFFLPVVGGPYNTLKNQASVTISDIGLGTAPTSISGTTIKGEVPSGTNILPVELSGDMSDPNGGIAFLAYGPLTDFASFGSPASMRVVLDFTLISADVPVDGAAAFAGQLLLRAPEPGTLALLGLGLAALGILRRKPAA